MFVSDTELGRRREEKELVINKMICQMSHASETV